MDSNKWIGITIGIAVAVVILSAFVPVVTSTQETIGEPITLTNNSAIVLREIEDGDVLKCVRTKTSETAFSDVWTLNDEPITNLSGTALSWNVGLISDGIYMQINSSSNSASGTYYNMTASTPGAVYFGLGTSAVVGDSGTTTFTYADGNMIAVNNLGLTMTVPCTWGYVICNLEDGQYYSAETGGVGICKKASDLILCGAYTSGALDTMYSYVNGVSYVSNSAYTMTVDTDLTKHTGTTDIYDITVSVVMSDGTNDETFTPYRVFLPYEVTGHQTKGALYDVFGLLPLIAGVGLLLFACIEFLRRY